MGISSPAVQEISCCIATHITDDAMYTIKLPNFEGPLDLLLFFIRRDELDVYDIPIARITKEFLEYIRLMQLFDLELAGEFMVMASTLMQIKAHMLLPKEVNEHGEEIAGDDPRAELVQQLLQYTRFKEVTPVLAHQAEHQRYAYYRNLFDHDATDGDREPYKNATLFDLLRAFKRALERTPEQTTTHTVQLYSISIEEQTDNIRGWLVGGAARLSFVNICIGKPRIYIVVTFLAILEMSKNQMIMIEQTDNFDDIVILPYVEEQMEEQTLDEVLDGNSTTTR
ncbi:MAG: segregation/condensation protein A [Candidatus Kapabacteria bacterium]|nr:segregation/condensation protein A [Candidatus Kapabacteria bacterium]